MQVVLQQVYVCLLLVLVNRQIQPISCLFVHLLKVDQSEISKPALFELVCPLACFLLSF